MDLSFVTTLIDKFGYLAIFFAMLLEGSCLPAAAELVLGFAGFLVYQAKLSFASTVIAAWLGTFTGSIAIYQLSRYGGNRLLGKYGHIIHLTPEKIEKVSEWFNHFGPIVIVPWRQMPFIRPKISIIAGLLKMQPLIFITYTAIGTVIWCTIGTALGYYLGYKWPMLMDLFNHLSQVIALTIAVTAVSISALLYNRFRKTKEEAH